MVLNPAQIKEMVPIMNISASLRYPVMGASFQPRAGVARHDAIAWGFARAADRLGVDILQNCEVIGIQREGGQVVGIETTCGTIKSKKVGVVSAGHSTVLADMAGGRHVQRHSRLC